MKIATRYQGLTEIESENIFTFPQGLPGFSSEREFVFIALAEESPFLIMQSLSTVDLAFLTLEPWDFFPDYSLDHVLDSDTFLAIEHVDDLSILVIATHLGAIHEITVNLVAPLLLNCKDKIAQQVVLVDTEYTTCQRLFPDCEEEGAS